MDFHIENGLPETHAQSANVLSALCSAGIVFAHLKEVIQEDYRKFILDPDDDDED